MHRYELKIDKKKKWVIWEGTSGLDACQRYAESHPGEKVMAWRDYPRYGVFLVDYRNVIG